MNYKMKQVRATAVNAIRCHFAPNEVRSRLLDVWAEQDGTVVLHVNSVQTAAAVAHGLWPRYEADSAIHPEHGVLVWVS